MKIAPTLSIALASLALASCVSRETVVMRTQQYVGRNADEFWLAHGPPAQRMTLNSGETLYTWTSEPIDVPLGSTTTTSGAVSPYGTINTTSQTLDYGSLRVSCALRLLASSDGTVKSVQIVHDSLGMWTSSRCNEILKR